MDARPSHADAKPSASYRDKSGICNLCGIFVMPSCVKEENHSNNWKVHQLVCYKRYVLSSLISATIFSARAASGMTRSGRRENGIISTVYGPA